MSFFPTKLLRFAVSSGALWALPIAALSSAVCAEIAQAQSPDTEVAPSTPERERSAEEAYDRATRAYLAEDFETAARLYETANDLAPAPAALIQAIRAHQAANHEGRAATLALYLRETYGEARVAEHTRLVREAATHFLRLDVLCTGCTLEVDGDVEAYRSLFLDVDRDHRIVAHFASGEVENIVRGGAGEYRTLQLDAPGAPLPPPTAPAVDVTPRAEPARDGLPPIVTYVGAGVTGVLLALTLWSAFDTKSAADEYNADPTQERLDEGLGLELRTNLLLTGTATFAVGTAIVALFLTDWDGHDDVPIALDLGPSHLMLAARGSL